MTNSEISENGKLLAAELDDLASRYHEKSDQHEILAWEADIVRAKVRDLSERCGLPEYLGESTLLGKWGADLAMELPSITDRVKAFHVQYERQKSNG